MKAIIFGVGIFLFCSCNSSIDVEYIKSTGWSYSEGYRVTDFLTFDKTGYYTIKNDTLFVDGRPRALIAGLNKKKYDLTIKSLDGGKEGHYMDEKEMQH